MTDVIMKGQVKQSSPFSDYYLTKKKGGIQMNDKQKHIAGLILQAMREAQDVMAEQNDLAHISQDSELIQKLAEAYSLARQAELIVSDKNPFDSMTKDERQRFFKNLLG